MQNKGFAAYFGELLGTLILTFLVTSIIVLYVAVGQNASFGSDFAVVGLTRFFVLFVLIASIGVASGGHFNPAVTAAFMALRRMDPVDGAVYMLAQLSGGVLGALLTKAFFLDEGRAADYGATSVSPILGGDFQGMLLEGIGTFILVLTVLALALNPDVRRWAPLAIGAAYGLVEMFLDPLTGGAVNPARWFGPALVSGDWGGVWPYLVGPFLGALLAVVVYRFIIEKASGPDQELADELAPRGPAPPAGEAPHLRQEHQGGKPPASPPGGGGIVGS